MIDFHAHILPNIDDGSRSIDETFNLIKEAQNVGFDEIVLTPHYKETVFETDVAERGVWLDAITKNLTTKNIKAKLYLANEIYMTDNIIKLLENEKASTINNTSYVLFELPKNEEPLNLYDLIYEMQQNKIVPVLAHPERYVYVQKEPELLYDLVEEVIERQLKKYRTKLVTKQQNAAAVFKQDFLDEKSEDDEEIKIIRTKKFDMKPMYPEDACVEMELLGHDFYVFINAETEDVNVVYKRKGNTYGLIEPEY